MIENFESYPIKDEMADYLESYVEHFQLPYQLGVKVKKVEKQDYCFTVHTSQGTLQTNEVVVASGAFQKPYVPSVIEVMFLYPIYIPPNTKIHRH
ncbi:NAD(P)-binding domain-containing protein [Cytobacillus purgationiresistens]|uniref:Cation diffusion facilitator CzcD-associated flavoprotein CzcO n=1 Tax=Cytobacillus purgationiresistens TaxID=863449 RepID=A0ABU0ACJ2_9BACI|nr:NAD(P)-binding domain-containing protein [Cytobacillus purgationiresistens]MDQ0268976.1 cation diffusion facilitator CzcD-associated flavoprotein CzcO [Cytobacillus purgationiresistens]